MSGAGRKGSYRKGVTDDVLNGMPVPEEGEVVARVKAPRGGNIVEIICDDGVTEGLAVLPQKFRKLVWVKRGDYVIASGATKDIEVSPSSSGGGVGGGGGNVGAVKYRIVAVLYKDQVRHIKSQGLWPRAFNDNDSGTQAKAAAIATPSACDRSPKPAAANQIVLPLPPPATSLPVENAKAEVEAAVQIGTSANKGVNADSGCHENDKSDSSESEDDMSDLIQNTNRRCYRVTEPETSSEENEEEEEEED